MSSEPASDAEDACRPGDLTNGSPPEGGTSNADAEDAPALGDATATGGEYVVVARRYRPLSFDQLVGQQQVSRALSNAITTNRVGHAYLFTGARGVGKTSTARILAKCLNCVEGPTPTPCGKCDPCQAIAVGEDIDVLEIDGASNRGIDEIRQLRSNVNIRPSRSRFKVYIIDEVHMLTVQAFNALLKTLEEPPEHVKFIFCTTDPEKIPITVLSRCQRFDFAPVSTDEIAERLRLIVQNEGIQVEDGALRLLARRAAGSMRDSQSLLEQLLAFCGTQIAEADVHSMLGTAQGGRLQSLADHLLQRDSGAALSEVDQAIREGVDAGQLTEQLLGYFRDIMFATVGCDRELLMVAAGVDPADLKAIGTEWGLETILAALQILDHTLTRMRQSTQVRTLVEIAIVRICHLEQLDSLPELMAQLQSGQLSVPASHAPAAASRAAPQPSTRPPKGGTTNKEPSTGPPQGGTTNKEPSTSREEKKKTHLNADPRRDRPLPRPAHAPPQKEPSSDLSQAKKRITTPAEAELLWAQAMEEIGGITGEFGSEYKRIAISAPNQLVVELSRAYNKERCERADVKRKIEDTLSRMSGCTVRVSFEAAAEPVAPPQPKPSAASRIQRQREIEQHPLVKEAMELFDAEVVRIDEKRGGKS